MRRLRELEDLGHLLGIMVGPKTQGRKSTSAKSFKHSRDNDTSNDNPIYGDYDKETTELF